MLAASILSALNCLLIAVSSKITLPFYLTIPCFSLTFGISSAKADGKTAAAVILIIVAAASLAAAVFLFFMMKEGEGWFVTADLLVGVDILFGIAIVFAAGGKTLADLFSPMLNLVYHAFLIYYIESGRRASHALTVLPDEDEEEDDSGSGENT